MENLNISLFYKITIICLVANNSFAQIIVDDLIENCVLSRIESKCVYDSSYFNVIDSLKLDQMQANEIALVLDEVETDSKLCRNYEIYSCPNMVFQNPFELNVSCGVIDTIYLGPFSVILPRGHSIDSCLLDLAHIGAPQLMSGFSVENIFVASYEVLYNETPEQELELVVYGYSVESCVTNIPANSCEVILGVNGLPINCIDKDDVPVQISLPPVAINDTLELDEIVVEIPTMGQWGLICLALCLAIVSVISIKEKTKIYA